MESFASLVAAALVVAVAGLLLKNWKPEFGMLASVAAAAVFMGWTVLQMIPVFTTVTSLAGRAGIGSENIRVLLKCLGICCLSEIGTSLCKESGQQAAASQIELAGKVLILASCMPVYEELLTLVLSLLE